MKTFDSILQTMNNSADFWHHNISTNVYPADTKNKRIYENWSQWQDKSIPDEVHEEYKRNGDYDKGFAVMTGKLWLGPYKSKYLVAIDLDNKKAIEEFVRDRLEESTHVVVEGTSEGILIRKLSI